MFVYSIVINDDSVTIGVCEVMFVAGERQPFDACQQVVKQAMGKVLSEHWASVLCDSGYGIETYLESAIPPLLFEPFGEVAIRTRLGHSIMRA